MAGFDFTPDEERALENSSDDVNRRVLEARRTVNPALASNMQDFYRRFPYAPADALVPAAQAYTDGRMTDVQVEQFLNDLTKREIARKEQEKKSEKKKGWWERNVKDKIKTASRYTMATLNFVPQYVQGGIAQIFDENDSVAGWFISTDLGSLIANDEVAGEGFFIGGRAAELQAERARRYRGTVDGSAFTIGRGIATVVSQPGTEPYRVLSGLVDAAAAILTPSVPGGAAATGLAKSTAGAKLSKVGLRSLAGLTNAESALIIPSKVDEFLNSRAGRGIINKLAGTNTVDEMMEIFPTANPTFLVNASQITDVAEMDMFLRDTMGLGDVTRGIGPSSVQDINISRWDSVKTNIVQRENLVARMMSKVPGQHVVVTGGSAREQMNSLKNIKNYLKLMRVKPKDRQQIIQDFAEAFVNDDGSMKGVLEQTQKLMKTTFANMGVPQMVSDEIVGNLGKFMDDYQKDLYGAINSAGSAEDFGGRFTAIVDGKIVAVNQPLGTAGLQSEMLKHGFMLPDPRRVRRLASNIGWITGKKGVLNPDAAGKARLPLSLVEGVQNELWRPFTLMTGGYVVRNMGDSLLRQSFAPGIRTGIFHPLQMMQVAMFKKMKGDLLGDTFKGDPEDLLRGGQREMAEAAAGTVRESYDPAKVNARQKLTGSWRRVKIGDGRNDYMKGVAAELSLLATDDVARMVAAGDDVDTIIRVLSEDPDLRYLKNLQNRWKNRTMTDSNGNRVVGTVEFLKEIEPGKFVVNDVNLREFITKYVMKRVDDTTGRSPKLKEIIARGSFKNAADEDVPAINFKVDSRTGENVYDSIEGYEEGIWQAISEAIDDPNITLRDTYKMQDEVDVARGAQGVGQNLRELKGVYDRIVDKFFSELYPKREAFLNRSPVFRQYYYNTIKQLAEELDANQAGELASKFEKAAKLEGQKFTRDWLTKYVGDRELANDLFDIATGSKKTAGKKIKPDFVPFDDIATGKPVTVKGYRGTGGIGMRGTGERSLYGPGIYVAREREYAEQFAKDYTQPGYPLIGKVEEVEVTLNNPLVINSNEQWRALTKEAGWEFTADPNTTVEQLKELRRVIESKGYDGVVVKGDIASGKGYMDMAGGEQVVSFDLASKGQKATRKSGNLTLEQLDAYAKGFALDETKRLFYNATEKSNFADILRIVAPFGSAWAEVMNRWVKNLATEPETLKRAGITVQGLQKADPDGDGKGFFYKDPVTGQYMFNYPFSDELGPLVMMGLTGLVGGGILGGLPGALIAGSIGAGTGAVLDSRLGGVDTVFSAPAQSLSMGLSILPGVGPYVQVAADKIIGDKPDVNFFGLMSLDSRLVRKAVTPYGEPDVALVTLPAWADKMWQAWTADPETDRFYGDLKVDTMRALASSGQYDLQTAEGRDKLDKEASSKARILLMLRALGQFTGPARPTPEFKLNTKQGDMYASEISKAFYEMQAENYDTAVPRFLETFGEDFFVYVAGKTKAVDGGLDATAEFGDWQAENKGVFRRHSEVAGYFAPVGSTFDYQVYLAQLAGGNRERLTSQEVLAEAQARVGISMYRSLVRQAGPNPSAEQQDVLRRARAFYGQKYPGFRDRAIDVAQQDRRINQLFEAMGDEDLQDNPVAKGLMEYYRYRQEALAVANSRGLVSLAGKTNADLRAILRRAGETIALSIPEFERVWERVLYNEVDL